MLQVKINAFSYLDKTNLEDIEFSIQEGTNLALIGESGCGKSTLLKIIYGLFDCDEGVLFWKENQILGPKYHLVPGMPFMKYLAQDFDLMPFITVGENVGKFLSNFYPEEKQRRIDELLDLVEMSEYKQVKAKFLSGGQMQRVALARVLAQEPEVLLLDEPFSHIDNFRKNTLRRKIFKYLKEKSITTIIATHDVNDVLSFSDEVVVLKQGKIIDLGTTIQIYQRPKHIYTASLFGDVNEVKGDYLNKSSKTLIIYPNQLEVVDWSTFLVEVKAAYFKGAYFLNEATYEEGVVFFESELNWTDQKVYLQYKNTPK
jgi:ABC-type sulfate/molybdate transport systems ATPase subunit